VELKLTYIQQEKITETIGFLSKPLIFKV